MKTSRARNAGKDRLERLVRPVHCYFCNGSMFYVGDDRHVPEVRLEVHGSDSHSEFYAHATCWNERIRLDALAQKWERTLAGWNEEHLQDCEYHKGYSRAIRDILKELRAGTGSASIMGSEPRREKEQ